MTETVQIAGFVGAGLRTMRLHQWAKNLLLFVPIGLTLGHASSDDIQRHLLAFLFLAMCNGTFD